MSKSTPWVHAMLMLRQGSLPLWMARLPDQLMARKYDFLSCSVPRYVIWVWSFCIWTFGTSAPELHAVRSVESVTAVVKAQTQTHSTIQLRTVAKVKLKPFR
jgi:hypothetical protein